MSCDDASVEKPPLCDTPSGAVHTALLLDEPPTHWYETIRAPGIRSPASIRCAYASSADVTVVP